MANPSQKLVWAQGIGSISMPQSQNNVSAPAGRGNVVNNLNVTVNPSGNLNESTRTRTHPRQDFTRNARADHEIYSSQLLTKKIGFPLWVPGPGRRLPIEYRQQGISIGDVGIITSTGAFDFLFNIFHPADHAINRGNVPRAFVPLSFDELVDEVLENEVYGPGSYLASSSVRKTSDNWITKVFSYCASENSRFESTEKEAAILIMPDGSISKDLRNTLGIRDMISSNAQAWYIYARRNRGRDVKNGDIRVVIGVDKVPSWGIATSMCNTGQTASFVFKHDSIHFYRWECIGGSGRVGPNQSEIHELMDSDTTVLPPQNQCVFVRTINFTLSGEMRNNFPSETVEQSGPGSGYPDSISSNPGGGEPSEHGNSGNGSTSSGHEPEPGPMPGSLQCKQSVSFDPVEPGVDHPSTALHNYLHEKFPDANMVITEDMDWISVLKDDDMVFPDSEDLCARIEGAHEVQNHGGIVQLFRREDPRSRCTDAHFGAGKVEGMNTREGTNNSQVSSATRKGGIDQQPRSVWATDVRKFATRLGKQFAVSP